MKQTVRIIGGQFRGKKLVFPDIEGLRPTPDRVRETVFNWLMQRIKNAHCLDAFAGSGALGLEAYSRGAAKVTLIEQSTTAYQYLHKTLMEFNSSRLKLLRMDTRHFLRNTKEQFDIVFLDPPFESQLLEECLDILSTTSVLSSHGLVYIESSRILNLDEDKWQGLRAKRAGQVFYGLYEKVHKPVP
ncbi:16S rRNA (guanine(966)-N(2))-methyltransferase RsmD [Legionella israelensis]|uniref:Ribosomal RNA small subunit methyltransferase D n=1 Tax=Legionella israelensis TaxID=454 RepID=A0A0W0V3R2_9GAMM|nr:16S rRNA (guanine(966)-N(2))-methyltransferase RsmD [Legionella israelensis]KTD14470.1 methyltransferase [Legionella israelensis]QBS09320.1 16S rRNA (guanine(966)-N(2))-methyltransferase RsmD [Legionella israelensis]SCX89704.1 16S rRNA (guanine966-N2)-methyltransferase [Legionella israelensis DSM 19235]STX60215.1 methyltransferase [Legionella israelensis]